MLQVKQPGHQPGRQGWPTAPRSEVADEVMLDPLPVHKPSQEDQRGLHVKLLIQARTKHLGCLGGAGVGPYGQRNLQESSEQIFVFLQISHHTSAEITLQINELRVIQGGLISICDTLQACRCCASI